MLRELQEWMNTRGRKIIILPTFYSDYLKSFSSGHYFKVMVGFNAELYKTRNISAQKNTLITPSVPTLNTATG